MVRVGERVKLSYLVKEFDIQKYIDGDKSYSFKNVQLCIPNSDNGLEIRKPDFLPCWGPIILANYEEELLEVTVENNRRIGYTKSFRIDLLGAIKEGEIIIGSLLNTEQTQNNNEVFKDFIDELVGYNMNYACGLITKSERKKLLIDPFQHFYKVIFKDELDRIRKRESNLTNEDFFSKTWKRYLPRKDSEEIKTKVGDIIFIWTFPPTEFAWYHQFILEGIRRGIDKKTNAQLSFGGLRISKEKVGDFSKNRTVLTISSTNRDSIDKIRYNIGFWDESTGREEIEIENIWQNIEFKEMLERVIESPVY